MFHHNIAQFLTPLKDASFLFVILGVLSHSLIIMLLGWRFKIITEYVKENISYYYSTLVIASSQLASYFSPFKIGLIVTKPLIMNKVVKIPFRRSLLITAFEQFYENSWQILLLPIFALFLGELVLLNKTITKVAIGIIVILLGLAMLKFRRRILDFLFRLEKKFPRFIKKTTKKIGLSKENIHEALETIRDCVSDIRFLGRISLPTLIFIFVSPLSLWLSMYALDASFSYLHIIPIYWIALIIGKFSGVPGGLGTRDATIFGFLKVAGLNNTLILNIIILYRIVIIIPNFGFGLYSYLVMGRKVLRDGLNNKV